MLPRGPEQNRGYSCLRDFFFFLLECVRLYKINAAKNQRICVCVLQLIVIDVHQSNSFFFIQSQSVFAAKKQRFSLRRGRINKICSKRKYGTCFLFLLGGGGQEKDKKSHRLVTTTRLCHVCSKVCFYCATAAAAIATLEFAAKPLCCETRPFSTAMLSSQCLICPSKFAHSFWPNVRNKVDFTFTLFAS